MEEDEGHGPECEGFLECTIVSLKTRDHEHPEEQNAYRLSIVLLVIISFFFVELIGAYFSNSLALLSDAGHMFTDITALVLALFAIWLSTRPATPDKTYGFYRGEILAAFVNGILLVGLAFFILFEAYQRFQEPPEVQTNIMMAVAAIGLGANLLGVYMLHGGAETSLNVRGAFLHVMGDTLSSIGTLGAGVIMFFTGYFIVDPLLSVVIAGVIIYSAGRLVNDSMHVLLEGVPRDISLKEVRETLENMDDVEGVHDLHVWTVKTGLNALSAHVVTREISRSPKILDEAHRIIGELYGIYHITLQVETEEEAEKETHL